MSQIINFSSPFSFPDLNIAVVRESYWHRNQITISSTLERTLMSKSSFQAPSPDSPTTRRRCTMATWQMTLPCNFSGSMSYLLVPVQDNRSGNSARHSPSIERRMRLQSGGIDEVEQTETANSPIIMRWRLGPQSSIESYYSFASEGNDICFSGKFGFTERKGPKTNNFWVDFKSSISELFCLTGRLETKEHILNKDL